MLKLFISIFIVIGSNKACEVTTSGSQLIQAAGTDASLVWNIHRPYNFILNTVQCYRSKTASGRQRTTIAKLQRDQSFGKTVETENDDRIVVKKTGERYVITIKDVRETDAFIYSCYVTCISGIAYNYNKEITLVVQDDHNKPTTNNNGTNGGEPTNGNKDKNKDDARTQKALIIAIGVISVLLLMVTTIAIVYCVHRKRNKNGDENTERQSLRKEIHHEEQQYADLSDFQSNNYGQLDSNKENHEYEYVDQSQIQPNNLYEKPTDIFNGTYEAINTQTLKKK